MEIHIQDTCLLKHNSYINTISSWGLKRSDTQVFCIACATLINCELKEFQVLIQHSNSNKHNQKYKDKLSEKQLHLYSVLSNVTTEHNVKEGVQI